MYLCAGDVAYNMALDERSERKGNTIGPLMARRPAAAASTNLKGRKKNESRVKCNGTSVLLLIPTVRYGEEVRFVVGKTFGRYMTCSYK